MEDGVKSILIVHLAIVTEIPVWMLNYLALLLNHVLLVQYVRAANASVSVDEPDCDNQVVNYYLSN
jgi:hypothetical protein